MRKSFYFLLASLLLFSYLSGGGCSDSSITDDEPAAAANNAGSTGGGTSTNPPASMVVSITPSSGLSALGTATVSATVRDAAGAVVADGTTVTFSVSSSLGSITSTATTVSGVANATFTAGNTAGTVGITVTSGSVSASGSITILGANVGSIQFSSATPDIIGVKGSGQAETAIVTFSVKDVNGQPAPDGTSVTFTLTGPNGGESLNPSTASTVGGLANTTLQSGSVAGAVRVTASTVVSNVTISSSSTGVSIGGGVPSMKAFTLAASKLNLAGLSYVNLQSTISAFLADRFGNFNILQGTSISFWTEAGAIDASNITDVSGQTSVTFRTQNPMPVSPATAYAFSPPVTLTGNPNDGISTIIATTRGEECFLDINANGVFDGPTIDGFPASCDIGEPFIDANDNGVFDAATEVYIDTNGNGAYDVANGIWDSNIIIWKRIDIAFTGGPSQIVVSPSPFAVTDNGSQTFNLCVADANANSLMAGSTVGVATNKGTLTGGGPLTMPDISIGPYCFSFSLADADPGDTDPAESATLTVTVTSKVPNVGDLIVTTLVSGTID